MAAAGRAGGQGAPGCAPGGVELQLRPGRLQCPRSQELSAARSPYTCPIESAAKLFACVRRNPGTCVLNLCPSVVRTRQVLLAPGAGGSGGGRMKFCRTEKTEAELRRHWLPAYGRTLEVRSLEVRWEVWGCCSPLLPARVGCLPLGSRPLFPRCVRSPLCGPGSDSEGSGAPRQPAAQETFDRAWGSLGRPGEPAAFPGICLLRT